MQIETIEKPVCIREVNENIRRVRLGLPLTRSLKCLNTNCKFKEEWTNAFNISSDKYKEERKVSNRKAYKKYYYNPKNTEKIKEIRAYQKKFAKRYYIKNKAKILERCRKHYSENRIEILKRRKLAYLNKKKRMRKNEN